MPPFLKEITMGLAYKNLTPGIKTDRVINATAAGVNDVSSAPINMQGFQGIRAVCALGALTAGQQTRLIIEGSDEGSDDGNTYTTLAQSDLALDADSNKLIVLEYVEPTKQYLRVTVDRGGANAAIDSVVVELFRASYQPPALGANVSSQKVVAS